MKETLIKYGALAALVLQNTVLVVAMRYSRTVTGPMYSSATAVVMTEVFVYLLLFLFFIISFRNLLWLSDYEASVLLLFGDL